MANEKTPVVWDDTTNRHRPLGTGEKMGGLDASSLLSSDSGNLLEAGSDGLAYLSGSGVVDPRADNLLEESDRGKLQVTVDRIAEWLDGHPQDAAALADAINVVSGDSGNVIVEGTDKGAFLSKGAIAAAVAGMTDAQKAQLADAIAARIASDIADGKTIVASNGKLTSDPTNATAAQKKAINQALADADSGLVVNNSTGKLQVDFSQMPTDKFEALLKGLKMQVPLSSNMNLYVSTNNSAAGDDIVDGRGTAAKPFKHIQDCVNYATSTYAVGKYHISIRVVAGTYQESVALPDFDRGTGYIEICSDSGARDVTVVAQYTSSGHADWCFDVPGGFWVLRHIAMSHVARATSSPNVVGGCIQSSGSARVDLYGCAVQQSLATSTLGGEDYAVRLISADAGGTIRLYHDPVGGAISAQSNGDTKPAVYVFNVARSGTLWLANSYDDRFDPPLSPYIDCSGSCDTFLDMWQNGSVYTLASGTPVTFRGTMSGKRYDLRGGSHVSGPSSADYFPGTAGTGTVQASTYCWGLPDNS